MEMRTDIKMPADHLKEMRAILAAIQREAVNKGVTELVDLAKKADDIAARMLARIAN